MLLVSFFSVSSSYGDEWIVRFDMAAMETDAKAEKAEHFIKQIYGVDEVDLNITAQSITVTFESSDIDLDTLQNEIAAAEFSIRKTVTVKEG